MQWAGLVWMTGIALALAVAGIGYRVGKVVGKAVFAVGAVVGVGLIGPAHYCLQRTPRLGQIGAADCSGSGGVSASWHRR